MRLILIRHGQTPSNVADLLDTGEPGADLTKLGHRQAAAVPRSLAEERIDVVYASTLVRTQQTAEPLLAQRDLEVRIHPGLREISAGDYEMRGDQEAIRGYLGAIFGWADDPHVKVPGGESGHEVWDRYDEVLAEAERDGVETAVMFSHGAIMRSWSAARVANISADYAAHNPITNTGAIVLTGSVDRGWVAHAWEDRAVGGDRVTASTDGPAGEEPPEGALPEGS